MSFKSSQMGCIAHYLEDIPYPIIIGSEIATIVVIIPAIICSIKQWFSDIGKYKLIYPLFWVFSALIILLSDVAFGYCHRRIAEGWFGYLTALAVPTTLAIVMYISFFFLLGLLETVSENIQVFLGVWTMIFVIILAFIHGIELLQPLREKVFGDRDDNHMDSEDYPTQNFQCPKTPVSHKLKLIRTNTETI